MPECSDTLGLKGSQLKYIVISQTPTLCTVFKDSKPENIVISRSVTLCTEASKPERTAISRSVTLGSAVKSA